MAASRSIVLTFEIFKGTEFLRREESSSESVTIGKGPAAMLRVSDAALQDLHVVLNVNDDGSVQLHDLAADGSTVVNGKKVDSNVVLAADDVITIGPVRIVVRIADTAAYADEEATRVDVSPVTGASPDAPSAEDDDNVGVEDVMAYVMRASASAGDAGADRSRGKMLEVSQVFGDSIMGVRHFGKSAKVRVGASIETSMKMFGVKIAEIPEALAPVVPILTLSLGTTEENWKNPFYVPAEFLPNDNYVLFENVGGAWVCNITDKWAGFVDQGETRKTFQELIASGQARKGAAGYQIEISEDARLVVDLGSTIFVAHQAYPGKKAVVAFGESIDYPFLAMVFFGLFVTGMFFGAITLVPPPEVTEQEIDPHLVEMLLEKEKPEEKLPDKNPDAGEGAKAKKEEGKVGKKDAKLDKAKGEKVEKMKMDREVAENAGLLGALRDDSSLDSSLSNTGLSGAMQNGIGGLIGAKGTQMGSGGLGGRGGGLGGGGSADGLGGMGTRGRGSGASGYGSGGGNFGDRGEGAIAGVGGDPIVLGALDKSLIDAVIKRNMAAIRYCYQRELTKNPSLGGKITVKFVIAGDGTVSQATTKATTMNNPAVESCINGRFARFQFPQPKGGGVVIVSYPFIFSPG
ncbi:MAG TPA: AgmX/PglI C-terminal domain-containing protein [Myxococcota bacterium]|nr:AgmX/PglI C-terminal domain-containing protein [Myxococcota bacterium]